MLTAMEFYSYLIILSFLIVGVIMLLDKKIYGSAAPEMEE
jgi:hypothetical protein